MAAEKRAETIDYLRAREQVTMVYLEAWRRVWLDDDPRQNVPALCYVVDRAISNMPAASAFPSNCIIAVRATAAPVPAAIMCWRR